MSQSHHHFTRYALIGATVLVIAGLFGVRAYLLPKQDVTPDVPKVEQAATKKQPKKKTAAQVKKTLLADWQTVIDNHPNIPVDIAVYSPKYHTTFALNNSDKTIHTTASILKVAMITQVLHNHAQNDSSLTATEQAAAKGAIENSNNNDATTLYHAGGSAAGLNNLFANLKMTDSMAYSSGWVHTKTTALDQLKLLSEVFDQQDYLTKKSQAYIQDLMSNVEADQAWGISAGAAKYQLKNGWRLNSDNTWIVNSIGHLENGSNSCTIAILTDKNADLQAGIDLVEALATAVGQDLNLTK